MSAMLLTGLPLADARQLSLLELDVVAELKGAGRKGGR